METNDYKKFKFFSWNREIDEANVKNKMKLIKQNGYEKTQPILVSSKFEIWDGQHRFIACNRLGVPVYYEITDDMTEERIKMINSNTRRWDLTDNITSNAKKGIVEYQFMLDIMEKFKISQSAAIVICPKVEIHPKNIRKGFPFEINPNYLELISFLFEAKKYLSFWNQVHFVRASKVLIAKATKEELKKILNHISSIQQQARVTQYLTSFENIANYHRKSKYQAVYNQ